jgi:hypothetical protein
MKYTTLFVAMLVLAGGPGRVFAQYGADFESIEWIIASSDVVVRATVEDLAFKDFVPAFGDGQWVTITLKVEATLKGKAPEKIVLIVKRLRGEKTLPNWKQSSQSVLWFLNDIGDRPEKIPPDFPTGAQGRLRLRSGPGKIDEQLWLRNYLELGSPKTGRRVPYPVFSMDLQVLADEDKIVEAVKAEAARQEKEAIRSICIPIPYDVANRTGRAGAANQLTLPINGRLEQLAHGWVAAKDGWLRQAGVQALSPLKSEANIAILKGMLDDRATSIEHRANDDHTERVYYVREAAWKTLRDWKVPVPDVILREPLK